jgi:hypothetical protein
MTMETMNCAVEVWPVAADEIGVWLVSGGDAWRSPPIPADSEPHFELELLLGSHEMDHPELVHSTSWRPDGPTIVLTYIAALPCSGLVRSRWPNALPVSADLPLSVGKPYVHAADEVPIPRYIDVLHHALRHLTYLISTDATAREALAGYWPDHLAQLEPALAGMYEA